jgi:hypothetical protein
MLRIRIGRTTRGSYPFHEPPRENRVAEVDVPEALGRITADAHHEIVVSDPDPVTRIRGTRWERSDHLDPGPVDPERGGDGISDHDRQPEQAPQPVRSRSLAVALATL